MIRIRQVLTVAVSGVATACLLGAATAAATPGVSTAEPSDVRDVDWRNETLPLPEVGFCPAQTVDFTNGAARTPGSVYRFAPNEDIVYADVTGEGVEDALIFMQCGPPASEYSTAVIAMTTDAAGNVRPLGTVSNPGTWTSRPSDVMVFYGDIGVAVTDTETGAISTRYYRWAASAQAFVRIDGP